VMLSMRVPPFRGPGPGGGLGLGLELGPGAVSVICAAVTVGPLTAINVPHRPLWSPRLKCRVNVRSGFLVSTSVTATIVSPVWQCDARLRRQI